MALAERAVHEATANRAQKLAKQLYEAFLAYDCEMLEINPLVPLLEI